MPPCMFEFTLALDQESLGRVFMEPLMKSFNGMHLSTFINEVMRSGKLLHSPWSETYLLSTYRSTLSLVFMTNQSQTIRDLGALFYEEANKFLKIISKTNSNSTGFF